MTAGRYVALGSSMAAGPGIPPRVPGSPWPAARSARNYPHLVAAEVGFDLVDVTYSGATTAHLLTDAQLGSPPQIDAVTADAALVTVTIGGNDIGYVPMLSAAASPALLRRLPVLGSRMRDLLDPDARERALVELGASMRAVGTALRDRAPRARVFFVDYLTLLPPPGQPAPPLSEAEADLGRRLAAGLAQVTAEAAAATGCELVRAADASRAHHAWSARPWTVGAGFPLAFLFGRPAPFHPNAEGMRAVADLVIEAWRDG
ncbi:SGNH/GDSL hydrolase family protein [Mycobacterium sp. ACS4331]|uniref:SGNH/GDSL hydrolase family protein n=1 Tax=Mycobacterium sp. ACS4331 TaxID=1834121 RepID=UPI000A6FF681|nr:SGNH/GDSL hydrolase family protein [Mycobacterium sp. ACS4331]